MSNSVKKNIRTLTGTVVSSAMDKTIVVRVEHRVQDPVYGKFVRRSVKMYAHDETNKSHIGDRVTIKESRPISRRKSWVLLNIIETAQ
jgi:small subunit ribosomal protein S17